jgi:4-amino-4-deoxy-L-arabinose transferase-like glycosyltransferase
LFTAITTGLIVFVVVVLFLFVARRALRLAAKLAIVGVLVLLLVAGAAYGWWQGWFGSSPQANRPASQTNQRPNSNRRPTPR